MERRLQAGGTLVGRPGERLADRYEILAGGRDSALYRELRALDHVGGREVSLWVVRPQLCPEAGNVLELLAAVARVRACRLPGVIDVGDAGVADGVVFLAVAAGELEPIGRQFAGSRLDDVELAASVGALAATLQAAHDAGLVHGCLRPADVFRVAGEPRIAGVGLWPALARAPLRLALAADARFLAPEVQAGEPPTARSDVYSLAALCAELALGGGHGSERLMGAGMTELLGRARPALARALAGALEPAPGDRPLTVTTVAALARAALFEEVAEDRPLDADDELTTERWLRGAWRRRPSGLARAMVPPAEPAAPVDHADAGPADGSLVAPLPTPVPAPALLPRLDSPFVARAEDTTLRLRAIADPPASVAPPRRDTWRVALVAAAAAWAATLGAVRLFAPAPAVGPLPRIGAPPAPDVPAPRAAAEPSGGAEAPPQRPLGSRAAEPEPLAVCLSAEPPVPPPPPPAAIAPVLVPPRAPPRCPPDMVHVDAKRPFCIDRHEAPGRGRLPLLGLDYARARDACRADGKRLCRGAEWELACRGARRASYPYGQRFAPGSCNARRPAAAPTFTGASPACVSASGAVDMSGNAAEWVEGGALRGGSWKRGDGRCSRPLKAHRRDAPEDAGYRCCADVSPGFVDLTQRIQ